MNEPEPGWTVERAVGRLAQVYSVEHVSRLSGYAVPYLRAQFRWIDHARGSRPSCPTCRHFRPVSQRIAAAVGLHVAQPARATVAEHLVTRARERTEHQRGALR